MVLEIHAVLEDIVMFVRKGMVKIVQLIMAKDVVKMKIQMARVFCTVIVALLRHRMPGFKKRRAFGSPFVLTGWKSCIIPTPNKQLFFASKQFVFYYLDNNRQSLIEKSGFVKKAFFTCNC